MQNEIRQEMNPLLSLLKRPLKFPPFFTVYAGAFAVWAWCGYAFSPALGSGAAQILRLAIPFWAAFTVCFVVATYQRPTTVKITGWAGLAFSAFALAVTVSHLGMR